MPYLPQVGIRSNAVSVGSAPDACCRSSASNITAISAAIARS